MHQTEGQSPVEGECFEGAEVAIDLIYRPSQTEFLRLAKERLVKAVNGSAMLFFQAYYSDCYYLGKTPSKEEADKLYQAYLQGEKI